MKCIIATGNRHKFAEITTHLGDLNSITFTLQANLPGYLSPEETGTTFEENALIKARSLAQFTGKTVLADDSGLAVDVLEGRPGVYSARYGGDGLTDRDRYILLLDEMKNVPEENRSASFVCVIALVTGDGQEVTVTGTCPGLISQEPAGEHGFGYDPVFFLPEYGRTMAQVSPDIKNRISHRARALDLVIPHLQSIAAAADNEQV